MGLAGAPKSFCACFVLSLENSTISRSDTTQANENLIISTLNPEQSSVPFSSCSPKRIPADNVYNVVRRRMRHVYDPRGSVMPNEFETYRNIELVTLEDPEYVAWRRRMADSRPSRGGPRHAGEFLGGLVEQCVRHWLSGYVSLQ